MFNPFGVDLEPMSNESGFIDYEMVLFQALVNEGKHTKVFNAKRPSFHLNGKLSASSIFRLDYATDLKAPLQMLLYLVMVFPRHLFHNFAYISHMNRETAP